jgi:hypothetical protein
MTPQQLKHVLKNLPSRDVWVLYHVLVQDCAWSLLDQPNVYAPQIITQVLAAYIGAHHHTGFTQVLVHALTCVHRMSRAKRQRIANYIHTKMRHIVQVQQDVQKIGSNSYQLPTYADLYTMSHHERMCVQHHLYRLQAHRRVALCS